MRWWTVAVAGVAAVVTAFVLHYFVSYRGDLTVPRPLDGTPISQASIERCQQNGMCMDAFTQRAEGTVYGWPFKTRIVYTEQNQQKTYERPGFIWRNAGIFFIVYVAFAALNAFKNRPRTL